MNDEELIKYIWNLLFNEIDNMPDREDFDKIADEFIKRGYIKSKDELFDKVE